MMTLERGTGINYMEFDTGRNENEKAVPESPLCMDLEDVQRRGFLLATSR